MEEFSADIERLADLNADELAALKEKVVAAANDATDAYSSDHSQETVARIVELGNTAKAIAAEEVRRTEESAQMDAEVAAAQESISALDKAEDKEETPEEVVEEEEEDVEEAASKSKDEEEDAKEDEEPVVEDTEVVVDDTDDVPVVEDEVIPPVVEVEEEETEDEDEEDKKKKKSEASLEDTEASVKEETEDKSEVEPEADKEKEAEAAVEDETEAVAASDTEDAASNIEETSVTESKETTEMAAATEGLELERPVDNRPAVEESKARPTIIASGATKTAKTGDVLPNIAALANVLTETKGRVRNTAMSNGERDYVASIRLEDNDDLHLYGADLPGNSRKIENYITASANPEAITAAGGLYHDIANYDDIFEYDANVARPVKDALPNFRAEQGGIRYYSPTLLKDLEGAASIWTIEDDIAAAKDGTTLEKPALRITAGKPIEAFVAAIPLILTFGNIGNQFYPELAERHVRIGMQLHARVAEQHLLTRIATMSTWVNTTQKLGFARDLFVSVETAASGYRNRNRLAEDATLVAVFPIWLKNAVRADLTMQLPGDQTFSISDSDIDRWFADRNIKAVFTYDGETSQYFGAQVDTDNTTGVDGKAGTADDVALVTRNAKTRIETLNPAAKTAGNLVSFPSNMVWYLFLDGTFLFLDGGTLDLGVVRDSALNKTNDYQMFLETFEGVAKLGAESLRISTPVKITGASSGTVDVA